MHIVCSKAEDTQTIIIIIMPQCAKGLQCRWRTNNRANEPLHSVSTSSSAMAERPRELGDFKKARVKGGTDNHSLKDFSQVSPLPLTDPHHMVIK